MQVYLHWDWDLHIYIYTHLYLCTYVLPEIGRYVHAHTREGFELFRVQEVGLPGKKGFGHFKPPSQNPEPTLMFPRPGYGVRLGVLVTQ